MPSLLEQQQDFASRILGRGTAAGLAVYRANAFGNWGKALAAAYPVARKIVGAEFFDGMAREYARAHPSTSGDLNEYGAHLPEFVAAFAHTQDLPYLADVARMEWLAHRAYYAADPAPFDLKGLSFMDSNLHAALRPILAPACALMASDWPLARIWAVHQDDYLGEVDVNLAAGPDRILVHRPRWRAEVSSLSASDYRFLEAALGGATLGEALERAAAGDPAFNPAIALASWVQAGVIASLEP